jgi:hypothetical protein
MANATETAAQNARTMIDESRVMADEAMNSARQVYEMTQASHLTMLEGAFQATNRWFEIGRLMLDQAESANREAKGIVEDLATQTRKRQKTLVDLTRENGRLVENTWLGVYRNGRKA